MAKEYKVIKVTYPDGKEVCFKSPKYTVLDVLRRLSGDDLAKINFMRGDKKVVTREFDPKDKGYMAEISNGWYYFTQFDTKERTNQLLNLNRQFNLNLNIEVGDFKYNPNPRDENEAKSSKRPKHCLIVTMPDGTIIDYDSYRDVFAECIYKLRPRRVSRFANIQMNRNRDLFSSYNIDGSLFKVDEHLYLQLPRTALEASNILKSIALRLRENIKIDYIPQSAKRN